jgi:WD40 repeat protein
VSACISPNSTYLIATTHEEALVWNLADPQAHALHLSHPHLKSLAVDPTGTAILTSGGDRTVRLWNPRDGRPLAYPFDQADKPDGALISLDGAAVLTYSNVGLVRIWNRSDTSSARIAHIDHVSRLASTADGQLTLAWDDSGTGVVIDSRNLREQQSPFSHTDNITAACISPSGQYVAVSGLDGEIIVWNRATGQSVTHSSHARAQVTAIAYAPDDRIFAVADSGGDLHVRRADNGELLTSIRVIDAAIAIAFNARGDLLLALGKRVARLVQFAPNGVSEIGALTFGADIVGAQFSPDGNVVAIHGLANRILLWNSTGGMQNTLNISSPANHVAFVQDSSKLLTVCQDGLAQIWNVADGAPASPSMRNPTPLVCAAISGDGQLVALCDEQATARVWHAGLGQPITVPMLHRDRIVHAQFVAPRQLVTITGDAHVQCFDINSWAGSIRDLRKEAGIRCGESLDSSGELISLSQSQLAGLFAEYIATRRRQASAVAD